MTDDGETEAPRGPLFVALDLYDRIPRIRTACAALGVPLSGIDLKDSGRAQVGFGTTRGPHGEYDHRGHVSIEANDGEVRLSIEAIYRRDKPAPLGAAVAQLRASVAVVDILLEPPGEVVDAEFEEMPDQTPNGSERWTPECAAGTGARVPGDAARMQRALAKWSLWAIGDAPTLDGMEPDAVAKAAESAMYLAETAMPARRRIDTSPRTTPANFDLIRELFYRLQAHCLADLERLDEAEREDCDAWEVTEVLEERDPLAGLCAVYDHVDRVFPQFNDHDAPGRLGAAWQLYSLGWRADQPVERAHELLELNRVRTEPQRASDRAEAARYRSALEHVAQKLGGVFTTANADQLEEFAVRVLAERADELRAARAGRDDAWAALDGLAKRLGVTLDGGESYAAVADALFAASARGREQRDRRTSQPATTSIDA